MTREDRSPAEVLALLLEEVQQLPSEEASTIDCSEFAQHSPERAQAARAAQTPQRCWT